MVDAVIKRCRDELRPRLRAHHVWEYAVLLDVCWRDMYLQSHADVAVRELDDGWYKLLMDKIGGRDGRCSRNCRYCRCDRWHLYIGYSSVTTSGKVTH